MLQPLLAEKIRAVSSRDETGHGHLSGAADTRVIHDLRWSLCAEIVMPGFENLAESTGLASKGQGGPIKPVARKRRRRRTVG
jgi:hypothetical protein